MRTRDTDFDGTIADTLNRAHTFGPEPLHTRTSGIKRILLFVACISLFTAVGCKDKVGPGTSQVQRPAVTGVTVSKASLSYGTEYYETAGTVKARTTSVVASRIMGVITSVAVREGERVSQGQLVMTIDDRDILQKIAAAEKAVEAAYHQKTLAEVTWERYKKLFEAKVISQQEFDQYTTQKNVADNEYERAKANLSEVRIYRDFSRVTAPVSGIVSGKTADLGSMAIPGVPLLTIEDPSRLTIDVRVDERMLPRLTVGMPVDVVIESSGKASRGRIAEIVPSIDSSSRSFLTKISVADAGLSPGQYARVKIPIGKKEGIFLPQSAIVRKGQLTGVYVLGDNGILSYRLVKTGPLSGDTVEVLSGLSTEETVVVGGADKAVDGGEVKQ